MKNFKGIIVIIITVSLVLLCGCSTDRENDGPTITTTLLGGSPSGVWFALSTAISESLSQSYEGSIVHSSPGNNYSNLFRTNDFETEFALANSTLAFESFYGKGSFESKLENLRSIACFYESVAHLAISADLGISSFEEIIENKIPIRISIGSAEGTGEGGFIKLVSLYGVTLEDMEAWGCKLYRVGNSESADLFADGQIDGMWKVTSAPTPTLTQAATNTDLVMVTFSEEIIEGMKKEYGYSGFTIRKEAYAFMNEDYNTFTEYTILIASSETSDETAYKITKAIHENLDYISSVHSSLEGKTAESLIQNLQIPLHPGAEKYYREAGLID